MGYRSIEFKSEYDFALSFAGADREVADAIFRRLSERELSVFYDKNEQHRILAENVEDYLAPIYKSEAAFVVVLLGKEYPKRIWAKFESEQFKERFGENAVIPIWFPEAPPGMFDETTKVGGITFDPGIALRMRSQAFATSFVPRSQNIKRPTRRWRPQRKTLCLSFDVLCAMYQAKSNPTV